MGNKIYVGSLAFSATEQGLANVFGQYGEVSSVKIITDRDTGRSKGFAFVEMATDEQVIAIFLRTGAESDDGDPASLRSECFSARCLSLRAP